MCFVMKRIMIYDMEKEKNKSNFKFKFKLKLLKGDYLDIYEQFIIEKRLIC